jgi:antitoxin CptB
VSVEAPLRWRCRRGMRELDQLLGWYLDQRYLGAGAAEREAFAALLEQQDPDLWNWLSGRGEAPQAAWRRIVDEIRERHRV